MHPQRNAGLFIIASLLALAVGMVTPPSACADEPAKAAKPLRSTDSTSFVQEMTFEGMPQPMTTKEFIAEDGRRRSEMSFNLKDFIPKDLPKQPIPQAGLSLLGTVAVVTIFDSTGQIRLTLNEPPMAFLPRTAFVGQARNMPGFPPGGFSPNALPDFKEMRAKPDQELGQRDLDGRRVSGFVAKRGGQTYTVWLDNATGDPVRVESDLPVDGRMTHITMKDFRFHQTLDEGLFSFDVSPGYEVLGVPKDGKFVAPFGLELAWSREGTWVGVAAASGPSTLFGVQYGGHVSQLNAAGEIVAKYQVGKHAQRALTANLLAGQACALLTFGNMQSPLEARSATGELLWFYPHERGSFGMWSINDICPADLNGDGLDEVIVGYGGFEGLHVLDSQGKLLWKNTDRGNIWHVAVGDVEGDAKPEVLSTCAKGNVQVFSGEGKHLRDIEPGFYANLVCTWQPAAEANGNPQPNIPRFEKTIAALRAELGQAEKELGAESPTLEADVKRIEEELDKLKERLVRPRHSSNNVARNADASKCLIVAAGTDSQTKESIALLDSQAKILWSLELPAKVMRAAIATERPWLAVSLHDGSVRVIDLAAGKEIARLDGQGMAAHTAWLPVNGDQPLLVVAAFGFEAALQAFRVTPAQPK